MSKLFSGPLSQMPSRMALNDVYFAVDQGQAFLGMGPSAAPVATVNMFVLTENGATGPQGPQGPKGDTTFINVQNTGNHDLAVEYDPGTVVASNGLLFMATARNTGNTPNGSPFWRALSSGAVQDFTTKQLEVQVDFGQSPSGDAKTTVAAPWVSAGSILAASISGNPTVDHPNAEDALVEQIVVRTANLVPGVGFDVMAHAPHQTHGKYLVAVVGK